MEGIDVKVEYKFYTGQAVHFVDVDVPARVIACQTCLKGNLYLVIFWLDAKRNEEWVEESELK